MSEHQHWIVNDGEYQTQAFYTDDASDPDADHPTEWTIIRRIDGHQLAIGWGRSTNDARAAVAARLAQLRAANPT